MTAALIAPDVGGGKQGMIGGRCDFGEEGRRVAREVMGGR